jgi:hypothetical protein
MGREHDVSRIDAEMSTFQQSLPLIVSYVCRSTTRKKFLCPVFLVQDLLRVVFQDLVRIEVSMLQVKLVYDTP